MMPRNRRAVTAPTTEPDLLTDCALVRLGDARTVERLLACGAWVLAEGDHMHGLVLAGDEGTADREGELAVGWVLLRWRRREVLVVLGEPKDEEATQ